MSTQRNANLDINSLNLKDASEALNLADLNFRSVKPEYREELLARMVHLRDRIRRLQATEKHIAAVDAAIARNARLAR